MSLKTFHIVFVTFSTLLAFSFCLWSIRAYRATGATGYVVSAGGGLAGGIALIVYGLWFWRKIRTREEERRRKRRMIHPLPVGALVAVLGTRAAEACSVCYGEAQGPMIDAARLGVWLLFGLVLALQVVFVAFFVQLNRRAKRCRERRPETRRTGR